MILRYVTDICLCHFQAAVAKGYGLGAWREAHMPLLTMGVLDFAAIKVFKMMS